jgi:transposase
VLRPCQHERLEGGTEDKEHAMSQKLDTSIAVIGIDIGKNSFHLIGQDRRGAIVVRQKWSRGQVEAKFANLPPCLIGMEACVGAHHLRRPADAGEIRAPVFQGQKNDYRDNDIHNNNFRN